MMTTNDQAHPNHATLTDEELDRTYDQAVAAWNSQETPEARAELERCWAEMDERLGMAHR